MELRAIADATVRVNDGAGVVLRNGRTVVVVTAHHVGKASAENRIQKGGTFWDRALRAADPDSDLAILPAPPELELAAIELSGPSTSPALGDPVWAAGFPAGWAGTEPVIAKGRIAGLAAEKWVNLDGSWGHSGGPICSVDHELVRVAGIMLGRAGDVNSRLKLTMNGVDEIVRRVAVTEAELGVQGSDAQGSANTYSLVASIHAIKTQMAILDEVCKLLDLHFRTGFMRFAHADQIRALITP